MAMSDKEPTVSTTWWACWGKRMFDATASAVLLIALSPVLALFAILVKGTSPGPVLFRQKRAGTGGRIFRPLKFRTMRGDRKPDAKELVPLDHPEITTFGRFLRRYKLDELPQLVNVFKGEMSLVGPRPTLPDQVAAYNDFRRQRLLLRPGITGLAQVYSGAMMSWDERILYDIAYVRRCGLGLDLQILWRTGFVMILGEARTARPFDSTPFSAYVDPPARYTEG